MPIQGLAYKITVRCAPGAQALGRADRLRMTLPSTPAQTAVLNRSDGILHSAPISSRQTAADPLFGASIAASGIYVEHGL